MCNPAVQMGLFSWMTDCYHPNAPSYNEIVLMIIVVGLVIGGIYSLCKARKEG